MPKGLPNPREVGFAFALAQVGLEMVAPMGLGIFLDRTFGWTPWATVLGFVLGFVGGFAHLIIMVTRHDAEEKPKPPGDAP